MEEADNLVVMPFSGGRLYPRGWQESGPDASGHVCSNHPNATNCTGTLLRSAVVWLELVGMGLDGGMYSWCGLQCLMAASC